jgi:hypothetical protein
MYAFWPPIRYDIFNLYTTSYQLWFPLISIVPLNCHLYVFFSLFYDCCLTILLLIFHYIVVHNIMSPYRPIKPYNSLKVKGYSWSEIQSSVYVVLQIQLRCTYGYTFMYINVLYPRCLIVSLTKVNSFKSIMCLCLLLKNSKWITKDFFLCNN